MRRKICAAFCFKVLFGLTVVTCGTVNNEIIECSLPSNTFDKIIELTPNSSTIIKAININPDVTSIIFGAHVQTSNITLSYDDELQMQRYITGKNVGLTVVIDDNVTDAHIWLFNYNKQNFSALIKLVAHKTDDPVPGGCNMEFPIEISPFLHLMNDQFSTHVEFQNANIGSPRHISPPSCSSSINYLSYDIFVLFLEEHNYSEEEYFKGLQQMSNISFLHNKAKKVHTYVKHPQTRADFLKYPKTGALYNIIAKYSIGDLTKEAAYVPSATYGCILVSNEYGCGLPYTSYTRSVLLVLSIISLFVAFLGHRFFISEMLYFGFIVSIFISFILISKYDRLWTDHNTLLICLIVGVCGGIFWLAVWLILFKPTISVIPVALSLGFLLTSTFFYTPLGTYEIFINGKIYWIFMCGGTIILALLLLGFPKAVSIIGSSIVASYVSVLYLDDYLGSNLIFIVLNVVKKALADKTIFAAINDFPFQNNNIIVSSLWVAISLLGIIIQTYMNRNKPSFSLPCCICFKIKFPGCTCSSNRGQQIHISNATVTSVRQPLLSHCNVPSYNSLNNNNI